MERKSVCCVSLDGLVFPSLSFRRSLVVPVFISFLALLTKVDRKEVHVLKSNEVASPQ